MHFKTVCVVFWRQGLTVQFKLGSAWNPQFPSPTGCSLCFKTVDILKGKLWGSFCVRFFSSQVKLISWNHVSETLQVLGILRDLQLE